MPDDVVELLALRLVGAQRDGLPRRVIRSAHLDPRALRYANHPRAKLCYSGGIFWRVPSRKVARKRSQLRPSQRGTDGHWAPVLARAVCPLDRRYLLLVGTQRPLVVSLHASPLAVFPRREPVRRAQRPKASSSRQTVVLLQGVAGVEEVQGCAGGAVFSRKSVRCVWQGVRPHRQGAGPSATPVRSRLRVSLRVHRLQVHQRGGVREGAVRGHGARGRSGEHGDIGRRGGSLGDRDGAHERQS